MNISIIATAAPGQPRRFNMITNKDGKDLLLKADKAINEKFFLPDGLDVFEYTEIEPDDGSEMA